MPRPLNDLERRHDGALPAETRAAARIGGFAARRRQLAMANERVFADLARRGLRVLAQRRLAVRERTEADARLIGLIRALADCRRQALRWRAQSAAK